MCKSTQYSEFTHNWVLTTLRGLCTFAITKKCKKMLRNVLHIVLLTIATGGLSLAWGQTVAFKGTVLDGQTRGTLDYATVRLFVGHQLAYGGITNANGRFELLQIKPGNYRIDIS